MGLTGQSGRFQPMLGLWSPVGTHRGSKSTLLDTYLEPLWEYFQHILGLLWENFLPHKNFSMTIANWIGSQTGPAYPSIRFQPILGLLGPGGAPYRHYQAPIWSRWGAFSAHFGALGGEFSTPQKLLNDHRKVIKLGHKQIKHIPQDVFHRF